MSQPVCDLLGTLNPGTPLNNITVDGATVIVFNFAAYNKSEGLATFLTPGGDFVVADCNKIGSIEFFNI